MSENLFKTNIEDVKLSAVCFDESFCMKRAAAPEWSLSRLSGLHQHSTYEIFFGDISIVTEGETLQCKSSVTLIPPYLNHYTVVGDGEVYSMYFDIERYIKRQGSLYDELTLRLSEICMIDMTDEIRFYIAQMARSLANGTTENTEHIAALLFFEVFSCLVPKSDWRTEQNAKRGKNIKKIDIYIAEHYSESITLSDLSRELYLCEKQISRIIKKEYGCSLADLITHRRLSVSCMLLKYTTMPIVEIAASVGYTYESNFFAAFKRVYGVTPRKYRAENENI